MTLRQKIESLPEDTLIAVGAHAGFFFFGTPRDWKAGKDEINARQIAMNDRVWRNKCKEKKGRAERNNLEYVEEPCPEHVPFEKREVLNTYRTTIDNKLAIIVEGPEQSKYHNLNDWLYKSEEQRAREQMQSMYSIENGALVRTALYNAGGYEQIREIIVTNRTKAYMGAYEQYLRNPSNDNKSKLTAAEYYIKDETFKTLCSGIDPEGLIKRMQRKVKNDIEW